MPRKQKRKHAADGQPANLKRFKMAVKKLTQEHDGPDHPVTMGDKSTTALPRKQRRKEGRKLKKMRRNAFHQGQQVGLNSTILILSISPIFCLFLLFINVLT